MKTSGILRGVWIAALAAMIMSAPALAQDEAPQAVHKGDIVYITGGYGLGEREAMIAVKKDYNLYITNANRQGQFTADIDVVIALKKGGEAVTIDGVGPLLYVQLPGGVYTVKVKNGDKEQVRTVNVSGSRKTTMAFTWANGGAAKETNPTMHMRETMPMERGGTLTEPPKESGGMPAGE